MYVEPIEVVGYLATAAAVAQFVPQVVRTSRSGDTAGLAPEMWSLLVAQALAWIGYGAREQLIPSVVTNVVLAACGAVMLRLLVINRAPRIRSALATLVALTAIELAIYLFLPNAVLGVVAAGLAFILLWPQVVVAFRGTSLSGLSRPTWVLSIGNTILWLVYGIGRGVPALWLAAGQALLLSIVVLARLLWLERAEVRAAVA